MLYITKLAPLLVVAAGVRVDDVEDERNLRAFAVGGDTESRKDWLRSVENQIMAQNKQATVKASTPVASTPAASTQGAPTNAAFATDVKEMLVEMMKNTTAANKEAQVAIDDSFKAFAACTGAYTGQMTLKNTEVASFRTQKASHTTCRTMEEDLWIAQDTCTIDGIRRDDELNVCIANLKKPTDPRPDTCKSLVPEETEEAWLNRMASEFAAKLSFYNAGKAICEQKRTDGIAARVECDKKVAAHDTKMKACNVVGTAMDGQACQAVATSTKGCTAQGTCHAAAVASHGIVNASIAAQEADHMVEYRLWKRIECLLKALGNGTAGTADSAQLDLCISTTYSTDAVKITYPTIPTKLPDCEGPPLTPCDADYLSDAYGSLPEHAKGNCNPCSPKSPAALFEESQESEEGEEGEEGEEPEEGEEGEEGEELEEGDEDEEGEEGEEDGEGDGGEATADEDVKG